MGISEIYIVKRDGKRAPFSVEKIKRAISKAFLSVGGYATDDDLTSVLSRVRVSDGMSVEEIQNQVEVALMAERYFAVAKSYMLYRQKHSEDREDREKLEFLINYCNEYKKVGANGIVMAEPLAGLLSPDLAQEFSADYVKQIVDAVQDDNFLVVYHNCGNTAVKTIDTIVTNGCLMYHFGNAINMAEMMSHVPENLIAMGNVDPAGEFRNGTAESVYNRTKEVMNECCKYKNFVISSGCDIPPMSPWENINAFFQAVEDFYAK